MAHDLTRKLMVEFVGTFALIFIGAGAIVSGGGVVAVGPGW